MGNTLLDNRNTVRSLTRGLAILRHLNAVGAAKPGEIAAALNIPRPTVYRLLQTLEELRYVALSPTDYRVRVTRLASSLGDGYAMTSQLCQIVGPLFSEYAPQIVWPLTISVYENAAMVIEETTHDRSPLSIDRDMIGYRVPMLRSASGRAYLGHCSAEERQIIIDHIRKLGLKEDQPFLEETVLNRMLADVASQGFGLRDASDFRPHTASISAPAIVAGSVVACISVIWIRSAMDTQEAIKRYKGPLREIGDRLAAAVEAD